MVVSISPSSSSSIPHLTVSRLLKSPRTEFIFDAVFLFLYFAFDPFLYFPSLCSNSPSVWSPHVWPMFYTQPFNILVTFIFKFQFHDCSIWVTLSLVVLTSLSLDNELIFHCFFECLLSFVNLRCVNLNGRKLCFFLGIGVRSSVWGTLESTCSDVDLGLGFGVSWGPSRSQWLQSPCVAISILCLGRGCEHSVFALSCIL